MLKKAVFAAISSILLALHAGAAMAQKDARMERGRYLVEGIVACGNCHAVREKGKPIFEKGLSGGMVFDEEPFKAFASNITPDPETGIGKWTDAQLAKAIREGIRPDGTIIGPPMPIEFYRGISDADLSAIVAYIRAQPAVKNAVPKSEYRIKLPPNYGPAVGKLVSPQKTRRVKYGAYVAGMGHCMDCHTPMEKGRLVKSRLGAGGRVFKGPFGESISRNLTPHDSGLKSWTDAEISRAIREGVRKDGGAMKPPMAYGWYKNVNDEDMKALIAYLRSLKPLPFGGK